MTTTGLTFKQLSNLCSLFILCISMIQPIFKWSNNFLVKHKISTNKANNNSKIQKSYNTINSTK